MYICQGALVKALSGLFRRSFLARFEQTPTSQPIRRVASIGWNPASSPEWRGGMYSVVGHENRTMVCVGYGYTVIGKDPTLEVFWALFLKQS